MKKALVLLIVIFVMAAQMFATGTTETIVTPTKVPEKPIYGGTLRMAIEAEPEHLDPHKGRGDLVNSLFDLSYDFLWRWDYDFSEFVPNLAKEWQWVSPLQLKVTLREGVRFHNGRELVADDIVYSIERIKNPMTASPSAANISLLKKVEATGKYTLMLTLSSPWFGLMDTFARFVPIVNRDIVTQNGDLKTVSGGSGPFRMVKWTPGYNILFEKNTQYWDQGKPYLDGIEIRFMPEYSTAKNALLSSEIDVINWPDSGDIDSLRSNSAIDLHFYSLFAVMYVTINTSRTPLNDPLVRRAIALVTDRNAYNQALYRGMGTVAYSPIMKNQPYYKSDWEYEIDIAEAKDLLAQAGYPNGFKTEILALKGAEAIMGEVLQADLAKIGIEGEITVAEIPTALDLIFTKEDFDLAVLGTSTSPVPDLFITNYLLPTGRSAGATGRWTNHRVIELASKGRAAMEIEDQVDIYQELFDIVFEENPMIFLAYPVRHPASTKDVQGFFAWSDIRYDWKNIWLVQ